MEFIDWATLGSAVFTAVAAGAALWTAKQSAEIVEASERPVVEAQVLRDPGNGMLMLALVNSGRGVARGTHFFVHAGGQSTENIVHDGFVPAGERVRVYTGIGPLPAPNGVIRSDLPDLAVMVMWRDAAGFVHYRTHAGKEYVPRTLIRRRPRYPDRTDAFRRLYPHVDIEQCQRVPHNMETV